MVCSGLQFCLVCCSVLQCVAVCDVGDADKVGRHAVGCSFLWCVAMGCSVLQCVM